MTTHEGNNLLSGAQRLRSALDTWNLLCVAWLDSSRQICACLLASDVGVVSSTLVTSHLSQKRSCLDDWLCLRQLPFRSRRSPARGVHFACTSDLVLSSCLIVTRSPRSLRIFLRCAHCFVNPQVPRLHVWFGSSVNSSLLLPKVSRRSHMFDKCAARFGACGAGSSPRDVGDSQGEFAVIVAEEVDDNPCLVSLLQLWYLVWHTSSRFSCVLRDSDHLHHKIRGNLWQFVPTVVFCQ